MLWPQIYKLPLLVKDALNDEVTVPEPVIIRFDLDDSNSLSNPASYFLTNKSSEANVSNETNNVLCKKKKKSKKGKICKATVKTKARYGLHCLNRAKENGYCMIHNKLYTPQNNLENL